MEKRAELRDRRNTRVAEGIERPNELARLPEIISQEDLTCSYVSGSNFEQDSRDFQDEQDARFEVIQ
jgi:hypothetical protein